MNKARENAGLVYSTDGGKMCPACRLPSGRCICGHRKSATALGGAVRVSLETKGRNGKSVTVVRGLAQDAAALASLGKELKAACGTGGTIKNGVIEVQGDHCERIVDMLGKRFANVKRAGG
ncbi:MAG TPA: stress response translation initiation inhibitor YciH [Burkholderiales bacterium]